MHGCKDSRDRKVKRGFKAARKEDFLVIEPPIVCYNHPASTDGLVVAVLKMWEKWLVGQLQKGFDKICWSCLEETSQY